ncbi:ATP-binding cassette domain-containing protein [Bacillus hwajinpoensis]|uniref:ATP-binding cassette domain-containing protein n=1 Tax=Guptibacillus hwajinpoensis TaxID=208199 RepID=A0A845F157_9BACL|nr:ABC transporter ATP-binding protein [Pseudalkalibacillus hwajinpoensis]MYL64519.1 ATP-binding cassette domain-containing protein [Pseudalkalibacillus hwajinpoensis]
MYAIETEGLTKIYAKKKVVNEIDLKVEQGSVFGFLGKNGAGKSTFINMLAGLIHPSSGSFKILGEETHQSHKMGVLPDYSTFYDDLTALQHLKYFSSLLNVKLAKSELLDLLQRVELEDAANVKAKKFSFGMKKKLGIAQALINKPDILFLDEPTSGVDANAVLTIHRLIQDISREGTTIFLTSHNLDEVEKLCDDIAIMNEGVITVQGSMQQLRDKYQNKLIVAIKHTHVNETQMRSLRSQLEDLASVVEWGQNLTTLTVDGEWLIPEINRSFLHANVDVFRIEVDEPSLEEIFIKIGGNQRSA